MADERVDAALVVCRRAIDQSAVWEWPGDRGAWVAAQVVEALTGEAPTRRSRVLRDGRVEMEEQRWDGDEMDWVPAKRRERR